MDNGIHFISGLPRSGSTLLAGILRQNPRFHAGMTSPVGSMYMALETAMSRRNEAAVFIDDAQRRAVLGCRPDLPAPPRRNPPPMRSCHRHKCSGSRKHGRASTNRRSQTRRSANAPLLAPAVLRNHRRS